MPVEIKKLIVRAVVESPHSSNEPIAMQYSSATEGIDQEVLVKNCVKQVLEILKQTKKR